MNHFIDGRNYRLRLLAAAIAMALWSPALALSAEQCVSEDLMLYEVLVTAKKREQTAL